MEPICHPLGGGSARNFKICLHKLITSQLITLTFQRLWSTSIEKAGNFSKSSLILEVNKHLCMEAVKKAHDIGHLVTVADRSKNKGSMSPFLPTCASYEPCIWIRVVSSYIYQLIFAQNWEKPICASLLLSCIILDHHHNVAPILCINGINPCIWVLSNCCWAACSFNSKKWFGSAKRRVPGMGH